jgi:hypothetical protein
VVVAFLSLALSSVRSLRTLPEAPEEPGDGAAADAPMTEAPAGLPIDPPDARRPAAGGP